MSTKKEILLPDISTDIYRSHSVREIIVNCCENTLSKNTSNEAKLLKMMYQEYLFFITSTKMKNRAKDHTKKLHNNAISKNPNYYYETLSRIKAFVSLTNKSGLKLYSGKSLDSIKDIYACRTIIDSPYGGKESLDLIKQCYATMDETINYFISLGLMPCDAEPPKNTKDFNPSKYPDIIVPDKSYLSEANKPYVKDYIFNPKDNGYQSLHVIFKDKYGNYFEYQVRTASMDARTQDEGNANSQDFKDKQFEGLARLVFDREKIQIPGYRAINNKVVIDTSGFEIPLPITDTLIHWPII